MKFIRNVCCCQSEEAFARNSSWLSATHGSHSQQSPWGTNSVFFNNGCTLGACLVLKQHTSQEVTSFWQTQKCWSCYWNLLTEMWKNNFLQIHVFLLPSNNAKTSQEILTTVQLESPLSVQRVKCLGIFPLPSHSFLIGSFAWKLLTSLSVHSAPEVIILCL